MFLPKGSKFHEISKAQTIFEPGACKINPLTAMFDVTVL
jgi:hypothetical protein